MNKSVAKDTVKLSEMPVSLDRSSDSYRELNENGDSGVYVRTTEENPGGSLEASVSSVVVGSTSLLVIEHNRRSFITISILCFINLINYMDRFTIAGVLPKVQDYYSLSNTECGLLQTSFIISYMIMAPVFGYLGDRYNRKYIMTGGIIFWSATTFMGSFIPSTGFGAFIFLRALVGTGEASYSTIAPTIIADLFKNSLRSKMLALFYFAIPVGSGLGYIVGSEVTSILSDWRWAMRVTPILGLVAVALILTVVREPPRGESEGGTNLHPTGIKEDLLHLMKNKSFVLSTGGSTCVAFAIGALAWWAPTYMTDALHVQGAVVTTDQVGVKFGVITCIAGVAGVLIGSGGAQFYGRYNKQSDPLVCAFGVLLSVPLLFIGCVIATRYIQTSWTLIFFGQMFLSFNWAIVADMTLYVVIPTRRSMAEAIQILTSHALGDAFSPYIIGAISDFIMSHRTDTAINRYQSLQYAMFITVFVLVIGGLCFLMTALFIERDKALCQKLVKAADGDDISNHSGQSLANPVAAKTYDDDAAWSADTEQLVN